LAPPDKRHLGRHQQKVPLNFLRHRGGKYQGQEGVTLPKI